LNPSNQTNKKPANRLRIGITLFTFLFSILLTTACSEAPDEPVETPPPPPPPVETAEPEPEPAPEPEPEPEPEPAPEQVESTPTDSAPADTGIEKRWEIAVFGGVNGEFGGLGQGSLTEDGAGRTIAFGIEYQFDQDASRVMMRNGRMYIGVTGGRTQWLDVTDQVGQISQVTTQLLREEDDGYLQLREETLGGERFRIFAKMGEIVAVDDTTAIGSRYMYWQDDADEIRRHVSIVSMHVQGESVAIITVADRNDGAELPDWYGQAAMEARLNAVRAAPALRYSMGMTRPQASEPDANDLFFLESTLNFLVPEAHAQGLGIEAAKDLSDEIQDRLQDKFIEDFIANWPPPGSGWEDYVRQGAVSLQNAVESLLTKEQIKDIAGTVLKNLLTKVVQRGLIGFFPYLGPYGLAAMLAEMIVSDLWDFLKANIHGDPHINGFDGRAYDFQAAGEFVYFSTPSFEVQQRFIGKQGRVTWAKATAVRFGDHVVENYYVGYGSRDTDLRIILDGQEVTLDHDGISLDDGGYVGRLKSKPTSQSLIVIHPGGSYVIIENLIASQNVQFAITTAMKAQISGGLGGVPDGDRGNDFTLRDGTVLDPGTINSIENMYGKFAASWRLTPDERLFTQGSAEDFLTPEFTDLPTTTVSINDFTQDEQNRARLICIEAGVIGAIALENCTYDVLVTGDPAWAQSSATSQVIEAMLKPEDLAPAPEPQVTRSEPAPDLPPVNVQLDASLSGASVQGELQWMLINRANEEVTIPDSGAAVISLMLSPGSYDVIISSDGYEAESTIEVAETGSNDFEIELVSREAPKPFDAPATAPAGEIIRFTWRGPGLEKDVIFIASPNLGENRYMTQNRHVATNPAEAVLVTPAIPGNYEIRYFSHANGSVLFRQPLQITEPRVQINSPPEINAGTEFEAPWTGPSLPKDGLFIAHPSMDANRYWTGGLYHNVSAGSPANLIAPATPGDHEIRYYSSANGQPLVRQPIKVLPPAVQIEAPRTVTAGTEFEFSWSGPNSSGDFLFVAAQDMDRNRYYTQGRHMTANGPDGRFIAPAQAGTYEIRYFSGRNATVLAKRALIVR
jgi:hypothetical protein